MFFFSRCFWFIFNSINSKFWLKIISKHSEKYFSFTSNPFSTFLSWFALYVLLKEFSFLFPLLSFVLTYCSLFCWIMPWILFYDDVTEWQSYSAGAAWARLHDAKQWRELLKKSFETFGSCSWTWKWTITTWIHSNYAAY